MTDYKREIAKLQTAMDAAVKFIKTGVNLKKTYREGSGNKNSGDWNSGDWNSGNGNSGDWNLGNGNSGNRNSGNKNSGDWNSGDWNSGDWNSGDWNSGNRNSGNKNSGNMNSGNRNSGIFNTDEPMMRAFNKDTNIKFSDWVCGDSYIGFNLKTTEWISEDEMTSEEKKSNPKFFTTKGYLKKRTFKEAWSEWWEEHYSPEMIAKIKNLPNFNAEIFYKITGIRIDVGNNREKPNKNVEIKIDGRTKTISRQSAITLGLIDEKE